MSACYIYTLSHPITKEIRYVGKAKNIEKRFYGHINDLRGKFYRSYWIASLKSNNLLPVIEVIDEVPESEWVFWEKFWISLCKSWGYRLVNLSVGGNDRYNKEQYMSIKNEAYKFNKTFRKKLGKEKMPETAISRNLKRIMAEKSISLKELADKSGIGKFRIRWFIKSKTVIIEPNRLKRIATALEVPLTDLVK